MPLSWKEEFETVGFFYITAALFWLSIGFMGAYWVIYFSNLGIPFSSIALIFAAFQISSIIFEVPTGAIADVFGRKISVFLSYFFVGLLFAGILLAGNNVPLILFLYFLCGIAFTLETGALESWFVDTVKHKKKSAHLHKFFGRWGSVGSAGFVVGPLTGGFLVSYGVDKAFWASAIVMLLTSFFVLLFGREEYFKRKKINLSSSLRETYNTAKLGLKHTLEQKTIFILTVIMFLFSLAAGGIFHNAYQPFVIEVGMPVQFLGYALSAAGLISIFSLNNSHKIVKFLGGNKKSLMVFSFLVGLAFLGVAFFKYTPLLFISMVAATAFFEFSGNTAPAFRELFNKFIPSKIRATVLSVNSLAMRIGQIFGLVIFGLAGNYFSLQQEIILSAIILIISTLLYLKVK